MKKTFRAAAGLITALLIFIMLPLTAAAGADTNGFEIRNISAPGSLPADGGAFDVTINGLRLTDGFEVVLYCENYEAARAVTSGSDIEQRAEVSLPANITHRSQLYTISVLSPSGEDVGAYHELVLLAVADTLCAEESKLCHDSAGSSSTVDIEANYSWAVYEISQPWISLSAQRGSSGSVSLGISTEQNTGDRRVGYIALLSEGEISESFVIEVEQEGVTDPYAFTHLTDEATGVTISGTLHSQAAFSLEPLATEDTIYIALSQAGGLVQPDIAYFATLTVEGETHANIGPVDVILPVDGTYNANACQVAYINRAGVLEHRSVNASGGKLVISLEELTPFCVYLPQIISPSAGSNGDNAHGDAVRLTITALLVLAGVVIGSIAFLLTVPRREATVRAGAAYYLGKNKMPRPLSSVTDALWRAAASLVLVFKKR